MYDYHLLEDRDILCIDQKSFFASVACIDKGLDPMNTKLAVVADTKQQGAVVLAATPPLKVLGIKTGSRLYEIPQRNDIYIINPSMRRYLDISLQISKIALRYVPAEDLHQYSIDEFFMDVTQSYHLFEDDLHTFCQRLIKEIYNETGVQCTIGIGSNMLLSKVALDNEAKSSETLIAEWRYEHVPEKLWPIAPLEKFWGISHRTAKRLHKLGIFSIGQLAKYPHERLKKEFGIIGTDLHLHANGIDESRINEKYITRTPSICKSQILMRDYRYEETLVVMQELVEDVASRLREKGLLAKTIHYSFGYKNGGGVSKQYTLREGTHLEREIMNEIKRLADRDCDRHEWYRTLSVSATNIIPEQAQQLNLFVDPIQQERETRLAKTIDALHRKYGKGIVSKAISYTDAGTKHSRLGLMAGHKM